MGGGGGTRAIFNSFLSFERHGIDAELLPKLEGLFPPPSVSGSLDMEKGCEGTSVWWSAEPKGDLVYSSERICMEAQA